MDLNPISKSKLIDKVEDLERDHRSKLCYIELDNEYIRLYNPKILINYCYLTKNYTKRISFELLKNKYLSKFSKINLKKLLNSLFELVNIYKNEEYVFKEVLNQDYDLINLKDEYYVDYKTHSLVTLYTHGISNIIVLIEICRILEMDEFYIYLINIVKYEITIQFEEHKKNPEQMYLNMKKISIYDFLNVINIYNFHNQNLNLNLNITYLVNILIDDFIPPLDYLIYISNHGNKQEGNTCFKNYLKIILVLSDFIVKIFNYKIKKKFNIDFPNFENSNIPFIISTFRRYNKKNIEKIEYLLYNKKFI